MADTATQLAAAIATVSRACSVARAIQSDLARVQQLTKDDRSPVTVADFAVQSIVALELAERLGAGTLIVGEEGAGDLDGDAQATIRDAVVDAVSGCFHDKTLAPQQVIDAIDACDHDGSASAYWTLDPVDGTKGFLRGQQYAIALGYIENGVVTLGVMGCPNLPASADRPLDVADATGTIYFATRGDGARWIPADAADADPLPVRVAPWDSGPIRACESVEAAHSKQSDTQMILESLGGAGAPARLDSQCKYAVVARGQADAYLRMPTRKGYVEKIWDHAAGSIIAAEAGAVVSDVAGVPLDFTHGPRLEANRGIICAAAGLHPRIIEAIERLGIGGEPVGT